MVSRFYHKTTGATDVRLLSSIQFGRRWMQYTANERATDGICRLNRSSHHLLPQRPADRDSDCTKRTREATPLSRERVSRVALPLSAVSCSVWFKEDGERYFRLTTCCFAGPLISIFTDPERRYFSGREGDGASYLSRSAERRFSDVDFHRMWISIGHRFPSDKTHRYATLSLSIYLSVCVGQYLRLTRSSHYLLPEGRSRS